MTKKRHTCKDNIIYKNGREYCSLNPTELCQVLDVLEETCINMDERIKELIIENRSIYNAEDLEDAIYECYKFYTEYNNLTYSEKLLVGDFADHLINHENLFHKLKKVIKMTKPTFWWNCKHLTNNPLESPYCAKHEDSCKQRKCKEIKTRHPTGYGD